MSAIINNLLIAANDAYENGECQIHRSEEDIGSPRGDTLAEFLHIEISEACQGADEKAIPEIALNCIDMAIDQLMSVRSAIYKLT